MQRTIKVFSHKEGEKPTVIAQERPVRIGFLKDSTTYALVDKTVPYPHEVIFLEKEQDAIAKTKSNAPGIGTNKIGFINTRYSQSRKR